MSDTPAPLPTERDLENAAYRAEVAARMAEEYGRVRGWALVFGEGWLPSRRHFLVDKDEEDRVRYTSERPVAAATVYTVKNRAGEQRHFTVDAEGRVTEYATWEAGFGDMLLEPHPTRRIEVCGERVAPHRYSLCFAPYELYQPRSAGQLAEMRTRREERKQEKEDKEFAANYPLIILMERGQKDEERER